MSKSFAFAVIPFPPIAFMVAELPNAATPPPPKPVPAT